jgi:hypothetical protein
LPCALGFGGFRLSCVSETALGLLGGFAFLGRFPCPVGDLLVKLRHAFRGTSDTKFDVKKQSLAFVR